METKKLCEYTECIYNESRKCLLKNTHINNLGMCKDCLLPNIPVEIIEKYKYKLRERLGLLFK